MMKISVKSIKSWFADHIQDGSGSPYFLDNYQVKVIIDSHKNSIVVARAGSGKTRTLVAKIIFLIAFMNVRPEEILVFTFNSAAAKEVNQRIREVTCDGNKIVNGEVRIATTFHAFAYRICGGGNELAEAILSDKERLQVILDAYNRANQTSYMLADMDSRNILQVAGSYIDRAEQKYLGNYNELYEKIINLEDENLKSISLKLYQTLKLYDKRLSVSGKTDFSRIIYRATEIIRQGEPGSEILTGIKYIFIDEYQDFSQLFMGLILAIREVLSSSRLLVVGDDWQAINRFAGSDVVYFKNFADYFMEDSNLLRIPSNYRCGKLIIKNANGFMAEAMDDYNGSVAKSKMVGELCYVDVKNFGLDLNLVNNSERSELFLKYYYAVLRIIKKYPGKSVKLLARNNNLAFCAMSLQKFYELCLKGLEEIESFDSLKSRISYSTIHKSKGLEADVVILLECSSGVFPSRNKSNPLFSLFGDSDEKCFEDEVRLFYVALTRAKEALYLLSTTVPKHKQKDGDVNFFNYLDMELFEEFSSGFI